MAGGGGTYGTSSPSPAMHSPPSVREYFHPNPPRFEAQPIFRKDSVTRWCLDRARDTGRTDPFTQTSLILLLSSVVSVGLLRYDLLVDDLGVFDGHTYTSETRVR